MYNEIQRVYGAFNKNEDVLLKSSSGGIVHELCKFVFNNGGIVCSAVYNYKSHTLSHCMITDFALIDTIKGSKYIRSDMKNIYAEVCTYLQSDSAKPLLFIGTPCQCDAMKRHLLKKQISIDSVIFVDIVCHGVGSNRIWNEYINNLEKRIGLKIIYLTFKDKRRGWLLPTPIAVDENDNEHSIQDFLTLYNKHIIMQSSCYRCQYAQLNRVGDITVGDYWAVKDNHPEFYNRNGVSSIFVNTKKGEKVFQAICSELSVIEVAVDDALQPNLKSPTKVDKELLEQFWCDYEKKGLDFVIKKYASTRIRDKVLRKIMVGLKLWKL